jgi:transposase
MRYKHQEIARILRIDPDTVTNYVKAYAQGGLAAFHENHYRQPQSCLAPYQEPITKLLQENPPHSISKACQMIEECTGIRLKNSACREFLKKLGLKFRRVGMIPSGACPATQRDFHENELQPRLEQAKRFERVVYFVDAAHFVLGAFLGFLWCLARVFLRASAGRQRYNVLGAYDPVSHRLLTVTNDTTVNQHTICELLRRLAAQHPDGPPMTLVLDNAAYQRAKLVKQKALELNIELLFLPSYSPNLNLIERLWRLVKKQVLYNTYYQDFKAFQQAIDQCLATVQVKLRDQLESLMTLNFQLFDKSEILTV